ncbi:MAG: replicative DNA helicase [Prochloraceae cyanobacterium]|nr:replicative DNA helicase [Prochloraceae cyanobacterium]
MTQFSPQIDSNSLPPQNIDAEESILGGILLDPEALSRIIDLIEPKAFYVKAHQDIYSAAIALHSQGKPTDLMTVTTWLADRNLLDKIGGTSKLANLVSRTVSAVNIDRYAELVMDKYQRRELIAAGREIAEFGYDTASDLETILDRSEQKIFSLTQNRPQQGLVPISDTLVDTFNNIEKLHQNLALPGIESDFYDLDAMTSGFQRSDLIIVAGRPSMGKCLAAESEIVLADGSLTTIEEIYRGRRDRLLTLNNNSKFEFTYPSAFVDDGIKPVFRVTTRLGRFVETTITHPFLTIWGWRQLSQLKPGIKIAVPDRIDVFGSENFPESEIIKLLENRDVTGGASTGVLVKNKIKYDCLPDIVFKLKRSQISLLLNRLFATSGSLEFSNKYIVKISLTAITNKLARQVQHLLLRFGIIAAIEQIYIQFKSAWQLYITHTKSLKKFGDYIGFFGKEKDKFITTKSRLFQDIKSRDSEIYWDEIVSIEAIGEKQVYDLTIPETHNFVANDICVHNTSFALNIAANIAKKHLLPVSIFSLEMSQEQLAQRLLSSEARIESNKLRSGRISQTDFEPLSLALGDLSELPIFIDDTANLTVMQMRAQLRRLQAEKKQQLGLVLLDYLQLMEGAGSDNRVQELSKITRSLKGLARELNVPVIALSQLSRGVEQRTNKRPMLSDLRESGSIEQDADLVIMLYREEYYQPDTPDRGIAEVIIAKHRNGPTGTIKLLFQPELTKFLNMERRQNY